MPEPSPARKQTKRINFTVRTLNALPVPKQGRLTVYDSRSHLGLRVDANGSKSFFWFRTGRGGAPIFRSLGTHPATLIEKARADANELQGKLEEWRRKEYAGDNPFESPEAEYTFEELVAAYVDKRVAGYAAHPERAKKEIEWMTNKHLEGWKKKPLSAISDKMVRAMHREIAAPGKKTMADRVVQFVRRVYAWGIKEKMHSGTNPAIGIEFFGWTERDRFLSGEEIKRLFEALRQESNHDLRDFVNLSLWTGARRSDVLSMAWRDVLPLENNTWQIPEPKGGKSHAYKLPLVVEAVEILKTRQLSAAPEAVWVFPSRGRTGHLVEMKRGWSQLLKRAKIEDFHIHDLRRTLGSWQAGLGTSLVIIGKTLGHRPGSTATKVYARVDLEPVRESIAQAVAAMRAASKAKAKPALLAAEK